MKKLFTLALSLTLCCGMFAFAACKKDNSAPQSSSSVPTSSEVSSESSSEASSEISGSSESSASLSDEENSADLAD